MKAPELKKLETLKSDDDFTKTVQLQHDKARETVRKTFSIQNSELDYINEEALKMSQKAGKVISASEALRNIIQRDRGARS